MKLSTVIDLLFLVTYLAFASIMFMTELSTIYAVFLICGGLLGIATILNLYDSVFRFRENNNF